MSLDFMMGEPEKGAALIDLSQIALATVAVAYDPGEKFTVPKVRQLVLSTLKVNALKFKAEGFTEIIITVDNAKFGYWRRQFQDYYKRNRAIKRDADKEKESFDWEGYFEALNIVIQELKDNMPYHVIDVKFAEADDCIAVLSKYLSSLGYKVRIISSDGDFTQLHTIENVDQYSPIQKKFVKHKTGSPEEDCLTKIIKGDKKDCVASTKVRGDYFLTADTSVERTPPTYEAFIKSCVGKTDDEIYQIYLEDVQNKVRDKKKGLERAKNLLMLQGMSEEAIESFNGDVEVMAERIAKIQFHRFTQNRVLIDFNYIRQDIQDAILEAYKTSTPAPRGKIYSYFVKSGLTKLLPDINAF